MTDAQIIAIAITVLAVLAGSVFNNVRISEGNANLSRRIDDLRDVLRAEFRAHMTRMDGKLDTLIAMVGHLETRVTKLEERSH
jgi:hypothetical protein